MEFIFKSRMILPTLGNKDIADLSKEECRILDKDEVAYIKREIEFFNRASVIFQIISDGL